MSAILLCGCSTINNLATKVGLGKQDSRKDLSATEKYTSVKQAPIGDNIAGEWKVISVGKEKIEADEDRPYINFDVMSGRIYAYNGCNYLNGAYTLSKKNVLTFGGVISTMKYCQGPDYQYTLNRAVSDTTALNARIEKAAQDAILILEGDGGNILITLRRHNMSFMNGNWQIESVGALTIDDADATIFFDVPELKLHGNTGCNFFNGTIYVDPSMSNAIDFSRLGLTRMACPKPEQESAIILALEQTATAIPSDDGAKALLLDKNGKELMTLKRIPVEEE